MGLIIIIGGLDDQSIQTHYYCSNEFRMNYFDADVPVSWLFCMSHIVSYNNGF